jgi:hypothetical protein
MHLNSVTKSVQLAAAGLSDVTNPEVRPTPSTLNSGHRNRRIAHFLRRPSQQIFNLKSEINNLQSAAASSGREGPS